MGYRQLFGAALVAVLTTACGTIDRRVDPDDPDPVGGPVLRSQDIGQMVDKMSRDIVASGVLRDASPERVSFHITSLQNESGDVINRTMILNRIVTQLHRHLGRQVKILDRSAASLDEIRSERAAKRSGAVSSNPNMRGDLAGSDYVLAGVIQDRRIQSEDLRSVYYVVTFRLTDLETSELAWTNEYEAKFESEKSVISR